ncbi:type II secretion system F family protein [Streptomyces sp. 21So2-11]|uniref:type II secretion system F family protein n=1 Tax=Streptomyces sp. 21So2-11 TaxID=3144408 RepID=UPI00321BEFE4
MGVGSGPVYAAAVCAALAWLTLGREGDQRRARLLLAGGAVDSGDGEGGVSAWWERLSALVRRRGRREWLCVPVAVLVAVLAESLLPLIAGAVAVPLVGRRLRAGARRRECERRAGEVIALCGAVAGELRAGRQPGQALFAATGTGGLGAAEAEVMAAARFGGDVPEALRRASREPGADGLVGVAACWRVAVDGGAGLAAGLDRLEGALRAERHQRADLRAQLAGAWATVALLALLPVAGLLIGSALGAQPLRVLLHTPAGFGCLLAGGLLEGAGLWWAGRIVRRGEES